MRLSLLYIVFFFIHIQFVCSERHIELHYSNGGKKAGATTLRKEADGSYVEHSHFNDRAEDSTVTRYKKMKRIYYVA
jgi:hypothetical protein